MALAMLATVQTSGYINPWKLVPAFVLLLIWVRIMAWMDKDGPDAHLNREAVNTGMYAGLVLGYALFIFLPSFGLALLALILCFLADIGAYLGIRAKVVGLKDLKESLSKEFASALGRDKPKEIVAVAGAVQIINKSGTPLAPPDAEAAAPGRQRVPAGAALPGGRDARARVPPRHRRVGGAAGAGRDGVRPPGVGGRPRLLVVAVAAARRAGLAARGRLSHPGR